MSELVAGTAEQLAFLEELTANGLLIPSGVPGVYGRGAEFESLRLALDSLVTRSAIDDVVRVERMAFPPVIPRRQLEEIGYLGSFPHLAGSIFSFAGDEDQAVELAEQAAAHADWSAFQTQTDLVLVPAACYPSYPAIAARGDLPDGGVSLDLGGSYVFRNEPSSDPARMQMFHQRELVRFGAPEVVADWRQRWCDRALELLRGLGPRRPIGRRLGSVLRPHRPHARPQPALSGAQVRSRCADRRGGPDGRRVVQLPPGAFLRRSTA